LFTAAKEVILLLNSIQDVSLVRSATDATMIFQLILNKPATDAVFVDYKLTDGTANFSRRLCVSIWNCNYFQKSDRSNYYCSYQR